VRLHEQQSPEEFKTEAGALSTKLQMAHASRLSTLLKKIKWEERALQASKTSLLAVAEHVLGNCDYSKEEYNGAVALLAKYRLWKLIDKRKPIRCRQLIEAERAKSYVGRCCNCGRQIFSEESLRTGLGCVCRRKVGLAPRISKGEGQHG
jgi:hypothetical protein